MSSKRFLTIRYRTTGTRFWIYPQPGAKAEIVYLNAAPGTIREGPQDSGIYVVDAKDKTPYYLSGGWPPYTGRRLDPALPGPRGHFDHITPEEEAFSSATAFATIRCVLDIWEHYLGRKVRWYFRDSYPRLEVIPRVLVKRNAISKFGYIECGFSSLARRAGPWCQNFDIVAHEVGHIILKDVIGYPAYRSVELRAHEEASADLVALLSSLHVESVVRRLLRRTQGNLFSSNALSRFGELSRSRQLRNAFNTRTMARVPWNPDADRYKYSLALPFLGGAFDVLVGIYLSNLVRRGVIPRPLAENADSRPDGPVRGVPTAFARRFKRKEAAFVGALLDARDTFARLLVTTWERTSMHDLAYPRVVEHMLDADRDLSGGRHHRIIRDSFATRLILPAPG